MAILLEFSHRFPVAFVLLCMFEVSSGLRNQDDDSISSAEISVHGEKANPAVEQELEKRIQEFDLMKREFEKQLAEARKAKDPQAATSEADAHGSPSPAQILMEDGEVSGNGESTKIASEQKLRDRMREGEELKRKFAQHRTKQDEDVVKIRNLTEKAAAAEAEVFIAEAAVQAARERATQASEAATEAANKKADAVQVAEAAQMEAVRAREQAEQAQSGADHARQKAFHVLLKEVERLMGATESAFNTWVAKVNTEGPDASAVADADGDVAQAPPAAQDVSQAPPAAQPVPAAQPKQPAQAAKPKKKKAQPTQAPVADDS